MLECLILLFIRKLLCEVPKHRDAYGASEVISKETFEYYLKPVTQ